MYYIYNYIYLYKIHKSIFSPILNKNQDFYLKLVFTVIIKEIIKICRKPKTTNNFYLRNNLLNFAYEVTLILYDILEEKEMRQFLDNLF